MMRYVVEPDGEEYSSVLLDTSTDPPTPVAYDNGEPEDNSFTRDWKWVPKLLNEQHDDLTRERERGARLEAILRRAVEHGCHTAMWMDDAERLLDEGGEG
jgi:hypothetical protein